MGILTIATLQGATPPYWIPGVGLTVLADWVFGITIALFAISSLVFMRMYFESKTSILYWYSLSLAPVALGRCSSFLIGGATDVQVQWVGRFALYLGAVYLLISVLTTRGACIRETQD
jgi:hypothetical protein